MATITTTQPLVSPDTYRQYVDRLVPILESFEESTDFLSGRLRRWGIEVFELASSHSSGSLEAISRLANEKLEELTKEILIDPLLNRPLQDPIIERNWVWERSVHTECRVLFPEGSPLDSETMGTNPEPHFFALAMLVFVRSVNPTDNHTENQVSLFSSDPSTSPTLRSVYQRLAQTAIRIRRQQEMQERIKRLVASNNQMMAEIYRQDAEALGDVALRTAEHEAALERRLNSIIEVHQNTINGINEQITFMEGAHRTRVANLETEIRNMEETTGAIALQLRNQLTEICTTHQSTVASLNGQVNSVTQEAMRLEGQLSSAIQSHQSAMSAANSRIIEVSQRADQTASDLSAANRKTQEQAAAMNHMRNEMNHLRNRVNHLQWEVYNQDNGFCVIS